MKGLLFCCFMIAGTFYTSFAQPRPGVRPEPRQGVPPTDAPYRNAKLATDARVQDLIARMTLEEKIGQMTQMCASSITLDGTKKLDLNVDKIRDLIKNHHVGSLLSGTGTAQRWVDFLMGIQQIAVRETRLGIPVIFGMDHVHGADYVDEAIMFPHNLTLACSFDTELAASMARVTAIESADLGHHWNFAPVLDVGKNVNWPRLYETFGEDPLVCSRLGAAYISAFQESKDISPYKLAACAKHFIGYSDPKYGWDRAPSEIPDQVLHEFFTPSFYAAFKAGVKTLMVNSGELNGEPVHGSKFLLTDLLRKQMKFDGVVVTDIKDINKMVEMHGSNDTEKEATFRSVDAGTDMSMACSDLAFIRYVKELIAEKRLTEARIDESVRRILKLKFELGLFENPYPRADRLKRIGTVENYKEALKAAEESIVLLKNEAGTLPLSSTRATKVLLAGFTASSKRNLNGPWTLEWQGAPEDRQPKDMMTLAAALQKMLPKPASLTVADSAAEAIGSAAFDKFKQQISLADVVVLTVGEVPYSEFKGNATDLSINANHRAMAQAVLDMGKDLVLVVISGRPVLMTDLAAKAKAVIFAGYPGQGGGEALAKILTGQANPSGKLAFSWPVGGAHIAPYYVKKSEYFHRKAWENNLPLFQFGQGLSYTRFTYSDLKLSDTLISREGTIKATVTVRNTGLRAGKECVLWFLTDEVGTITRPVKKLANFEKVALKPGEARTLTFEINAHDHLSYPDKEARRIIEPGYHSLRVGGEEARFRLK